MKIFAAAFRGSGRNGANVVITAEVDASQLGLMPSDASMRGQLEVASAAVSAGGKVTHSSQTVFDLVLDSETYARAAEQGIRVVSAVSLPPDRHQRESSSGTSVSLYVEAYLNSNQRELRTVELKVEVRDGQQRVFRTIRDRRTRKDKGTEVFMVPMPLDVKSGSYALHVEATSGAAAVSRDIPIRTR